MPTVIEIINGVETTAPGFISIYDVGHCDDCIYLVPSLNNKFKCHRHNIVMDATVAIFSGCQDQESENDFKP